MIVMSQLNEIKLRSLELIMLDFRSHYDQWKGVSLGEGSTQTA
jgi:hypothetical protein